MAEAARQEQARKAAAKNASRHVYTEEDLKKKQILTPDDQAKVAARKSPQEQASAETHAEKRDAAVQESQTESLGEVARRYRREKEQRQAQEANKENYTPFQYELAHPTAGAPKANVALAPVIPSSEISIGLPSAILPPVKPNKQPVATGSGKARISPFQPRPFLAPPAFHVNPTTPSPVAVMPRSAPAAPRAVESAAKSAALRSIQVQPGDSWWGLAARHLGSGSRWRELRALNPEVGGPVDLLKAGIRLMVPEEKNVRRDSSPTTGANRIRVKLGDTLWSLAREHFGRGSAWSCLATLNPGIQDYQRIPVGTLLQLPEPEQIGACAYAEGLKN